MEPKQYKTKHIILAFLIGICSAYLSHLWVNRDVASFMYWVEVENASNYKCVRFCMIKLTDVPVSVGDMKSTCTHVASNESVQVSMGGEVEIPRTLFLFFAIPCDDLESERLEQKKRIYLRVLEAADFMGWSIDPVEWPEKYEVFKIRLTDDSFRHADEFSDVSISVQ